ncbi:MAG: N-acetylmuramoyl-L-alanine amidase [Paracoccaceae bacterium]|jgi:N-acetylmuramoyl-L-alanine amidase
MTRCGRKARGVLGWMAILCAAAMLCSAPFDGRGARAADGDGAAAPLTSPYPAAAPRAPGARAVRPAPEFARELIISRLDARRTELRLALSAPTPWRAFTLTDPARLVVDFGAVDWRGATSAVDPAGLVAAARFGMLRPGRARMVLDLATPARVREGEMTGGPGGGALRLLLESQDLAAFSLTAGWPEGARPPAPPAPAPMPDGPPLVVVDPGHGGVDPGAIRGEVQEKDLVLQFSRDLTAALNASGRWRAVMTRDEDVFLSLRERVAFAEAAGAALFLSIHVNALASGEATGASIHTLSETASTDEAAALASFENRSDVLAGVELAGEGDDVARALIDLSRRRTNTRSRGLARALVGTLDGEVGLLDGRAHSLAGFRVLKSPDIPSALIELGFMSTPEDLARIQDDVWRARFAEALVVALDQWVKAD